MNVREIMTSEVVTATPDTSVNQLARLMIERHVSGIPIFDGDDLVGIVTESDLIARNARLEPPAFFPLLDGRIPLETPAHYMRRVRHVLGTRAADVMTETVVTIEPQAEIEELAELLVKEQVSPIPVMEDGRLVGIASRADIVRMMARETGDPEADADL